MRKKRKHVSCEVTFSIVSYLVSTHDKLAAGYVPNSSGRIRSAVDVPPQAHTGPRTECRTAFTEAFTAERQKLPPVTVLAGTPLPWEVVGRGSSFAMSIL